MEEYFDDSNEKFLLENNIIGATSQEELIEGEKFAFAIRALQVEADEYIVAKHDEQEFKKLHQFLFQDVYNFAGSYRSVAIAKGDTVFCYPQFLYDQSKRIFTEIASCDFKNQSPSNASATCASSKTELNLLHPFREGNGRTIRIFLRSLAKANGFEWKYEDLEREKYIKAMIKSQFDHTELTNLIKETLTKIMD